MRVATAEAGGPAWRIAAMMLIRGGAVAIRFVTPEHVAPQTLEALRQPPNLHRVIDLFGSWNAALIEASLETYRPAA